MIKNIEFIVLLFRTPALKTDINKYSLFQLLSSKYKIIIFDLSPVLFQVANNLTTVDRITDRRFLVRIEKNFEDVEKFIKEYSENSFFIPMFNSFFEVRSIYKLFKKYDVRYGFVNDARTELEFRNIGIEPKWNWKNSKLNPVHMYKAFYNRIFRKMSNYKKAEFIVLGGIENAQMYIKASECNSQTKVVTIHSWDYERFLNSKQYDNDGKPYCVYLDTYLPFHPDLVTETGLNVNETLKSELLQERDKIFEYIENKYGLEIIIAAHPRANY